MTDLEQIKSKFDLVEYISKYVELKKAGLNFKGLCPFHLEKTSSFMVSSDKQIWHCFGCGRGGDIFKFVMEREGLEFVDALKLLAEQAGIQLSNAPKGASDERKNLLALNEWAAKMYMRALNESDPGRAARQYLLDRGLTSATIEKFRLGFAPTSGRFLSEALARREYKPELMEKAGLGVKKGNFVYDKFVGRIMFPLTDASGRVVGFTGRVIDPKQVPKYLNSPETSIFHKSELLYGVDLAKAAIGRSRKVVLVEGQMDVISSHQAGVENAVGISGTALTEAQLQILSRYADELVLSLDADAAGGEATKRAVELAAKHDLSLKVAILGNYKDPDEAIKDGPENWQRIIDEAVAVVDFYFAAATKHYDIRKIDDKKALTREMLTIIAKLSDPVEKDHYLKQLGRLVEVEPAILYDALKAARPKRVIPTPRPTNNDEPDTTGAGLLKEEVAVALSLAYPELLPEFLARGKKIKWASSLANTIYARLLDWYNASDSQGADTSQFIAGVDEPDRTRLLELMLVVEQNYSSLERADIARELTLQLDILESRTYGDLRVDLIRQIAEAEENQNDEKLHALLAQLKDL